MRGEFIRGATLFDEGGELRRAKAGADIDKGKTAPQCVVDHGQDRSAVFIRPSMHVFRHMEFGVFLVRIRQRHGPLRSAFVTR